MMPFDSLAKREYNKACSNLEGVDVEGACRIYAVIKRKTRLTAGSILHIDQ